MQRSFRLVAMVCLAVSAALVTETFINADGWARRSRVHRDLLVRQEENRNAEGQVEALRRQIDALRNRPEAQERVVRDELGYVRANEVIVQLDSESIVIARSQR